MKRSILKLRASLIPAILAAACVLGLLMHHGATENDQRIHSDAHNGSGNLDLLVESGDRLVQIERGVTGAPQPQI